MSDRDLSFGSLAEAVVGLTGVIVLAVTISSGIWVFAPAFFLEGDFGYDALYFLFYPVISVLVGLALIIGRRPIARYIVGNDGAFAVSSDSAMRIAVSILGFYFLTDAIVELSRLTTNYLVIGNFLDPGGSVSASLVQVALGSGLVVCSGRLSSLGLR